MSSSYLYTGKPIVPKVSLKVGDKQLEQNVDFDVEITDNINVGTAHVTIRGKGKFNGTVENTFTIEPVQAKSLSFFADTTEFEYDGAPKTMHIAVKFGDTTLTEGIDYTVEYSDNVKPGNASAKLIFSGNFVGAMNIPFTISNAFINTSCISSDIVNYKDSIKASASATGGREPYRYAFYIKQEKAVNWKCLFDYSDESECSYVPSFITDYVMNIKVQDADGNVCEKHLPFTVRSTLDAECTLSSEIVEKAQPVTISTKLEENPEDFVFAYLVRKTTDKKWTTIKRDKNITSIEYTPQEKGNYSICVMVGNGSDKNTKLYLKLVVE